MSYEIDPYSEEGFKRLTELYLKSSWNRRTSYEPRWMGIPVIQLPEDLLMMSELIWNVKPTVIVECGVAHGGAAVFYASQLALLGRGRVIGVEIEFRDANRAAMAATPVSDRIQIVDGSSVDPDVVQRVRSLIQPDDVVLVVLDSNHTRAHVRAELDAYAPMVKAGSYIVVFDGVMRILDDAPRGKAAWRDDNPNAATQDFLAVHPEFIVDPHYNRLGMTHAPDGFLARK